MKKWIAVLFVFNLIDVAATAFVLSNGLGVEYNPVVSYLYKVHPFAFLIAKSVVMWVALSVAWVDHDKEHVRLTLIAVTVFYGLLSLYQLLTLAWILCQ